MYDLVSLLPVYLLALWVCADQMDFMEGQVEDWRSSMCMMLGYGCEPGIAMIMD